MIRAALLAFALVSPAALAAPEVLDRILVVVNDGVILQSELERALTQAKLQIKARGLNVPPDAVLRPQVMDRLILARLQTQRAGQAGIRVDDRELNDVLTGIAQQNGLTLAQFAEQVKQQGEDYLNVREQVREEVLVSRVKGREVDSRVAVSDQDIELLLANAAAGGGQEVRLSHLLVAVPDGSTDTVRAKAREKVTALRERIAKGEDFAQIAVAESDGQQALNGGDLDWRKTTDLPALFAQAASTLKTGEISPVLEASGGFHLIKLAATRGGAEAQNVEETRSRHLLIQTNALRDDEQARITARDLHGRLLKGETFEKLAPEFSDDPGSKNSGGDLGFQPTGVFAPEFQVRLDQLKIDEISPPFRTQFGWHIAQVLERRTRDVSTETRRARARQAISQRKAAEEYEVWLRRLRAEAYVEYRNASDADAAKS